MLRFSPTIFEKPYGAAWRANSVSKSGSRYVAGTASLSNKSAGRLRASTLQEAVFPVVSVSTSTGPKNRVSPHSLRRKKGVLSPFGTEKNGNVPSKLAAGASASQRSENALKSGSGKRFVWSNDSSTAFMAEPPVPLPRFHCTTAGLDSVLTAHPRARPSGLRAATANRPPARKRPAACAAAAAPPKM